jgi:hypothetical protein
MELASAAEEELKKQGWTRMFTVELARVPEYVATYEEIGMEVRLETPAAVELDPHCAGCYEACSESFKTIYTRPAKKQN